MANKWGSEDEPGEKQSRKMGSRNTQSSADGRSENSRGPEVMWGHEVKYFTYKVDFTAGFTQRLIHCPQIFCHMN